MKQYLLAILLFTSIGIKAQLPVFKVDCGNDTFSCLGLYPKTDTFHIGTHIKITNGTPPYIYTWSCKPYKVTSHFTSTASYYLSDTSISNPYLMGLPVMNKPWRFYLTVEDNNSNIAIDSISVQYSQFIFSTFEIGFNLHEGDSLKFYYDHYVGGGIPPVKYYWTPTVGLEDSSKIDTWCKPHQSTFYYQYIIDSAGCKSDPNRVYQITILPTFIKNSKDKSGDLLDLYQNGEKLFFNNPLNKLAYLAFYSIEGKRINAGETNNSFFDISQLANKSNITICILYLDGLKAALKIY